MHEVSRVEQERRQARDKKDVARLVREKQVLVEQQRKVEEYSEGMRRIDVIDAGEEDELRDMEEVNIMRWEICCSVWGRAAILAVIFSFVAFAAIIALSAHWIAVDPPGGNSTGGPLTEAGLGILASIPLWWPALLALPLILPCYLLQRKYPGLVWRVFFCFELGPLRWRHIICHDKYGRWRPGHCYN